MHTEHSDIIANVNKNVTCTSTFKMCVYGIHKTELLLQRSFWLVAVQLARIYSISFFYDIIKHGNLRLQDVSKATLLEDRGRRGMKWSRIIWCCAVTAIRGKVARRSHLHEIFTTGDVAASSDVEPRCRAGVQYVQCSTAHRILYHLAEALNATSTVSLRSAQCSSVQPLANTSLIRSRLDQADPAFRRHSVLHDTRLQKRTSIAGLFWYMTSNYKQPMGSNAQLAGQLYKQDDL